MLEFDDYYRHQEEMLVYYMKIKYEIDHGKRDKFDSLFTMNIDVFIHNAYMEIR